MEGKQDTRILRFDITIIKEPSEGYANRYQSVVTCELSFKNNFKFMTS